MKPSLLLVNVMAFASYTLAQTTQREWEAKAMKTYPELAIQDSPLNTNFTKLVNERKQSNPGFFKDPKWPVLLANEIATKDAATGAAALPDGFAFANLVNQKSIAPDLLSLLQVGTAMYFAGKEVTLASASDSVRGLNGHGLKLRLVPPGPMVISPSLLGNSRTTGLTLTGEVASQNTTLGPVSTFRDAGGVTVTGIAPHDGGDAWNKLAIQFEWTPEPLAYYRADVLLGIWDPASTAFRPAQPGEAAATLPTAALKDAVTNGLPTKPRQWTDAQGRKIYARVLNFDPVAMTLSLDIIARGTTKNYPLSNLCLEDQACVIAAHGCQTAPPPDLKKALGR